MIPILQRGTLEATCMGFHLYGKGIYKERDVGNMQHK